MAKILTTKRLDYALNQKMRIGQSRHDAKNKAREELQREHPEHGVSAVDVRIETIHSLNTRRVYQEHCEHFVSWCQEQKGANKYANLSKLEPYAVEYLQQREEKGYSLYTLKAEKAALGKLYDREIPYAFTESRTRDKITRSRQSVARDRHFSPDRNTELLAVCRGTGGRRSDIAKLTPESFFTKNDTLYVYFEQSKGGRDRVAPVLPQYREAIEQYIASKEAQKPLFDKVHDGLDVHSCRREYAQNLYDLVQTNPTLKHEIQQQYPAYRCKGFDTYYSRDRENRFIGKKEDIAIVSQALGHNRLGVTVSHYLR